MERRSDPPMLVRFNPRLFFVCLLSSSLNISHNFNDAQEALIGFRSRLCPLL